KPFARVGSRCIETSGNVSSRSRDTPPNGRSPTRSPRIRLRSCAIGISTLAGSISRARAAILIFALKQALQNIIDKKELQRSEEGPLDPIWIRPLHERGKALREVLSNDIGTRRQSFM